MFLFRNKMRDITPDFASGKGLQQVAPTPTCRNSQSIDVSGPDLAKTRIAVSRNPVHVSVECRGKLLYEGIEPGIWGGKMKEKARVEKTRKSGLPGGRRELNADLPIPGVANRHRRTERGSERRIRPFRHVGKRGGQAERGDSLHHGRVIQLFRHNVHNHILTANSRPNRAHSCEKQERYDYKACGRRCQIVPAAKPPSQAAKLPAK